MVEEVLVYARGEARLDRRPVHLRELFSNLIAFNSELLRVSGVTVSVAARSEGRVDHDRMIRALQNLLSNAVEAASPDGNASSISAPTPRKDSANHGS